MLGKWRRHDSLLLGWSHLLEGWAAVGDEKSPHRRGVVGTGIQGVLQTTGVHPPSLRLNERTRSKPRSSPMSAAPESPRNYVPSPQPSWNPYTAFNLRSK